VAFPGLSIDAAVVTFDHFGSNSWPSTTTASGSFSFSGSTTQQLSLNDITNFSIHLTVESGNGAVIGYFDFSKIDLVSFSITLSDGVVTAATFETKKKQETSSPTNTDFHAYNFVALSSTSAKTQYGDGFTSDATFGTLNFSSVPEPSIFSFCFLAFIAFILFKANGRTRRCS